MKAEIYSHKNLIGIADLLPGDISMGCVYGKFEPTEFYFKHIAPKVKAFWSTSKPDYKSWSALRFNAKLENGYYLFPFGYTISEDDDEIRIDIEGIDREGVDFITGERTEFLDEPWETITIEQKIAFEDELHKELGNNNTDKLFKFFKKEHTHKLSDTEFCAVGTDCCDNVLYSIRKRGSDDNFALVHLTWKSKQEIDNFPNTKLYKEFDDFKIGRFPKRVKPEEKKGIQNRIKETPPGSYFIFCGDGEDIAEIIVNGIESKTLLNFAHKEAIKAQHYYEKHKLEFGTTSSHYEMPNMILESSLHLLSKTQYLIINTIGLSSPSIIEIATILEQKRNEEQHIFFVNSSYLGKDYTFDIKPFNTKSLTEIEELL